MTEWRHEPTHATTTIATWGPVDLVGMIAAPELRGVLREDAEVVFIFNHTEVWSATAILQNWRVRMNVRAARAAKAGSADLARVDSLTAWSSHARAVAADLRVIYGDLAADAMLRAADEVDLSTSWAGTRLTNTGSEDPASRARLLLTVELWAFERVRETMLCGASLKDRRGTEIPKAEGHTQLLQPAFDHLGVPTIEANALKMRVHRLGVKPGHEAALVADVLLACRVGPFGWDGRPVLPRK